MTVLEMQVLRKEMLGSETDVDHAKEYINENGKSIRCTYLTESFSDSQMNEIFLDEVMKRKVNPGPGQAVFIEVTDENGILFYAVSAKDGKTGRLLISETLLTEEMIWNMKKPTVDEPEKPNEFAFTLDKIRHVFHLKSLRKMEGYKFRKAFYDKEKSKQRQMFFVMFGKFEPENTVSDVKCPDTRLLIQKERSVLLKKLKGQENGKHVSKNLHAS